MMSLRQACQILHGTLRGEDVSFEGVSTDTRSLQPGDLYIALRGERFDGGDFIDNAQHSGAVAAVVHEFRDIDLPQIQVADTRKALANLARAHREAFPGKVVAVTGSNGKTTVKEMIAAILATRGEVLATRGNFNNDIGLPLTLLRMRDEPFAVIEMGANHHGEIDVLTRITHPDVALITNAGPAHLEGFGSVEGVSRAKGEIFNGLSDEGIAVINGDDQYADYWVSLCAGKRIIRFALNNDNVEVKGHWQSSAQGGLLKVRIADQQVDIQLPLPGEHNAMNALAAIAASQAVGIDLQAAGRALEQFRSVQGRLNVIRTASGMTLIDDTYNANPASLVAGINVLQSLPGEHWLVLGDMGELGAGAEQIHADAGAQAKALGVDRLLAIGPNSIHAVNQFGEGATHFDNKESLIDVIRENQTATMNVLIKGSRFMKMEAVVQSLTGKAG
jgi:UDP-N-acetylmuramoyl-tripeptide--D-alanyl-D-alanine ligase